MNETERVRRWRLILGGGEADGTGYDLEGLDLARDQTLAALYDSERKGGLGPSSPNVARWLGDIRSYFPTSVVQVMQKDAIDRLDLQKILLEPESLAAVEPDVNLVATLLSLSRILPAKTRDTARQVVRKVVEDLESRLASPLRQAVAGSLAKSIRNRRPKLRDIDWNRTIRANLRHYQQDYRTIIPETLLGYGRRGQAVREVILCLDQSGSMATSIVYAGVFGATLASIRALKTHVVAFDTTVVDLTADIQDPIDMLFSVQLGGGTDIEQALRYAQGLVRAPSDTIMILISDLLEGGDNIKFLNRAAKIKQSGVNLICLLALSDEGAPAYDARNAAFLASIDIPTFACTPEAFPELMAKAIKGQRPDPPPVA
ncbi:MAG TPA: VWA domain-containing protein [Fimbriimonadaceae bacterium]|nr:VWA domain-containing protein [Fimbriimonadaceae bacterium]